MDLFLFHLTNNLSDVMPWLSPIMVFLAKFAPLLFPLTLIVLWLTRQKQQQLGAFLAGISTLIALGIAQIAAFLYPRPRPYINHTAHLLIARSQDSSFPSDHAVFSFAVATMIWRYNRRVGVILIGLATLISFARVYVGTHYPTDVVGGAILGIAVSIAVDNVAKQPKVKKLLAKFFRFLHHWHLAVDINF